MGKYGWHGDIEHPGFDPDIYSREARFSNRRRLQGVPPTRVIHIKDAPADWRSNPDFVYIGRGSQWGNPYRIGDSHPETGRPMNRDDVCDLFERHELSRWIGSVGLRELQGKTLICFCHPRRCHGHSLAKAVEGMR